LKAWKKKFDVLADEKKVWLHERLQLRKELQDLRAANFALEARVKELGAQVMDFADISRITANAGHLQNITQLTQMNLLEGLNDNSQISAWLPGSARTAAGVPRPRDNPP